MDDRKILEDARKTLENIQGTQKALDEYEARLEKIIRQLEAELYKDEKLTVSDVTSINKQLNAEDFKDEEIEVEEEGKRKFHFNFILFLSIIMLLITGFTQFVKLQDVIYFNNNAYFLYSDVNLEPRIKMNSMLVVDTSSKVVEQDLVAYYSLHKVVKVKQIDAIESDKYVVKNVEQTIKSYEDIAKDDVIGVYKTSYTGFGEILSILMKYILVLYLITFLLFVIGLIIN